MHVALIESSRVMRKTVADMLVAGGHSVIAFDDSAAALAQVGADTSITCVLTSLEIQPICGLELCWSLRALCDERRPLTILVMSSTRDIHPLDEVLDSGADDFLLKPLRVQTLNGRLRAAERVLKLQQTLIRQADTDHLTQLLNRGAFMQRARLAVEATSSNHPLTVLQIDIDHFKSINDRFGHDVGDLVIRRVAHIIRETGVAGGRIGGEEFAALLPGHSLAGAAVTAHRIRQQCMATALPQMRELRFTVSIGLSEYSAGDSVGTLLKRADIALYAAKEAGRNRVAASTAGLMTELVG